MLGIRYQVSGVSKDRVTLARVTEQEQTMGLGRFFWIGLRVEPEQMHLEDLRQARRRAFRGC